MTSSRGWWRGFVVAGVASALACVLVVAVGPSFSKNDKGDPEATEAVEETSSATAPEVETSVVAASEESTFESTQTAAAVDSKTTPPGKNDDKAANGIDKHGYDPDPPPQNTPPATTGPTSCPGYDQGSGPYDHDNCDGTQGQQGNGGNGKCAGCTGKADDKSPGGQYPGDNNNGYECDNNSGVGKGNPAHSKCPTQTPLCVDDPNTAQDECNPPKPCVDDPNTAQDECNPPKPCVDDPNTARDECKDDVLGGTIGDIDGDKDDDVLGRRERNPQPPGSVMPLTGTSVLAYVLVGLQMIGAGALIARGRKRK